MFRLLEQTCHLKKSIHLLLFLHIGLIDAETNEQLKRILHTRTNLPRKKSIHLLQFLQVGLTDTETNEQLKRILHTPRTFAVSSKFIGQPAVALEKAT